MLESFVTDKFEYKKISEAEQKARRILGRLTGVIAETKKPTRNGRGYPEALWENVFENPIMKEKIANKCCFGELNHPEDRTEVDIEKVAICLAEFPKKGKDGKLHGVFDILDTPNGRILKTLCDYGCNIGISSRGQGDIITDKNGDDIVDPDTYECECFDAVLIPGVEAARLHYVTESLDTHKSLKQSLTESLESASDNERLIMEETIQNLNILLEDNDVDDEGKSDTSDSDKAEEPNIDVEDLEDIDISDDIDIDEIDIDEDDIDVEDTDDIDVDIDLEDDIDVDDDKEDLDDSDEEVDSDEDIDAQTSFIEYLLGNFDQDQIEKVSKILDLDIEADDDLETSKAEDDLNSESDEDENQNSDSDDSDIEASTDAEIEADAESEEKAADSGDSTLVEALKEALKAKSDLENSIKILQEKLVVSDAKAEKLTEECNRFKNSVARLSRVAKLHKDSAKDTSALKEALVEKDGVIKAQSARISKLIENRKLKIKEHEKAIKLNESLTSKEADASAKIERLTESLNEQKVQFAKEIDKLNESLNKNIAVKESYKKLANKAVNKYIEIKADNLGITPKDIKRKLGESYSLDDVDEVCKELKSYQLNVSKLPFSVDRPVGIRVNESRNPQQVRNSKFDDDDTVDDGLIKLANFD